MGNQDVSTGLCQTSLPIQLQLGEVCNRASSCPSCTAIQTSGTSTSIFRCERCPAERHVLLVVTSAKYSPDVYNVLPCSMATPRTNSSEGMKMQIVTTHERSSPAQRDLLQIRQGRPFNCGQFASHPLTKLIFALYACSHTVSRSNAKIKRLRRAQRVTALFLTVTEAQSATWHEIYGIQGNLSQDGLMAH